jgi:serine/threonine protein kinase
MGCSESTHKKPPNASPALPHEPPGTSTTTTSGSAKQERRLLDEYQVGATLGEGAFGVVSNCKHRVTKEEFAVKMVDKVETPVEAIRKEADMLQSLDHPNIVKFHGVFYERCFVCIVMDKYCGGDLVEGLQKHIKERGQINCHSVVHVAQQVAGSIHYLHQRSVVHRDIKGDNFLMDRRDMTEPDCKIVLTDFGTACNIGPAERLSASVGTKLFWAPEFYDKDYAAKVDVWAMGIVMYGLVTGRFPFRDETDVRNKEVKIPKRVHPVCEDYIKSMLQKREDVRNSAEQVATHEWVTPTSKKEETAPGVATTEEGEHKEEALRPDNPHAGIQERRQELINRLNKEHQKRELACSPKGSKPSPGPAPPALTSEISQFIMLEKDGLQNKYEWWPASKVAEKKLLDQGSAKPVSETTGMGQDASDLQVYSKLLEEHNIDISKFGTGEAKTLELFVGELSSGNARLLLDATEHKKLVRTVNIVLLRIRSPGGLLLVETEEMYSDGRHRETFRLPGAKKEPHENMRQTAERIAQDTIGAGLKVLECELLDAERYEEEMDSPSFPGVRTVYRKEIVFCTVTSTDSAVLQKMGLANPIPESFTTTSKDVQAITKTFNWMDEDNAQAKGVKLRPEGAEAVSALVRAPVGLNEEALRNYLMKCNIDPSHFGQAHTKTLKEFSDELIKGEATLLEDSEGRPLRVVDVILLVLTRGKDGEVLVQAEQVYANGDKQTLNRLPGTKRRPDENQFTTVRRLLRRQLELDEVHVTLDKNDQNVVEEEQPSTNYPGIRTLYRKRFMSCEICPPEPT